MDALATYLRELEPRRLARLADLELDLDDQGLPPNFKPTTAFRSVVDRYRYARYVKAPLMLVTGAHGAGKTTALRYIAHNEEALMWECRPGYQPKHLLLDIAQRLGVNAGTGWAMQTSIVAEQLDASPRMIVLDEAQRLDYDGADLLKYLADQSGSTFVLSASPSLEKRIERWPDIASRCTVRVRVSTMGTEEFVELYQADGFNREALLELHRISNGVMRTLQALLREIDEHLANYNLRNPRQAARRDLAPVHIRMLAEAVIG